MFSYLFVSGYSTAVGEKNNVTFYIAGAPRSKYKGQVVFFMNDGKNWNPMRRIDGEQVRPVDANEVPPLKDVLCIHLCSTVDLHGP